MRMHSLHGSPPGVHGSLRATGHIAAVRHSLCLCGVRSFASVCLAHSFPCRPYPKCLDLLNAFPLWASLCFGTWRFPCCCSPLFARRVTRLACSFCNGALRRAWSVVRASCFSIKCLIDCALQSLSCLGCPLRGGMLSAFGGYVPGCAAAPRPKQKKRVCPHQESNLGLLSHNQLYSPLYYVSQSNALNLCI